MPNINIILDDYTDVNNIMNVLQGVRGKWNTDVNNIMHVLQGVRGKWNTY